jgi:hypothetical protein
LKSEGEKVETGKMKGMGKEVRERKKKGTYMGTSCPRARFGTINRNEQDRIPPLY